MRILYYIMSIIETMSSGKFGLNSGPGDSI